MTDSSFSMVLPPAMIKRAREFTGPPTPARPAATVVLLRPHSAAAQPHSNTAQPQPQSNTAQPQPQSDTAQPQPLDDASRVHSDASQPQSDAAQPQDGAFQVYVLRRATTMVFGGVYAFPGGVVDPSDSPSTIRTDWADRLGVPDPQARAIVGAAARELFEEAGILLAGPVDQPGRTVTDVSTADWEDDRAAVLRRDLTMTDLLNRRGLRLRDDLLLPWARWITPEFEPRRYDTWFFAALLPDTQTARDVSGEADGTAWIDPSTTDLPMLPPTLRTLRQIADCATIPAVVAAAAHRDAATPLNPRIEVTPDGQVILHLPTHP
ncbi:NUDIX hydrolase [Actinoplanes sp. GCM10030250]|uniref:NUDIX hydrolase n=1 Tax=Actinoplanes sp. GCM10030250 TaxID=3273376 RepID=UPI0036146FB0